MGKSHDLATIADDGITSLDIGSGGLTVGTDQLAVDASGRVTMPYQPAACYHGRTTTSATQALPNATTVLNNGSHLSGARFTCPVDGIYRVSINGYTKYSGDYNWIAIRKNNTNVGAETIHWNKAGTNMHIFVSHEVLVECNSSDYLEAFQQNVNSVAADIIDRHFVTFELVG